MAAALTEKEFSQHLNTKFRVNIELPVPIELELTEVKGYLPNANDPNGMERFSCYFSGPSDYYLSQHVYPLDHERMGTFDVFLVPIGRDEKGFQYEAVFNYFNN